MTISSPTITGMLHTTDREFTALDRPMSPSSSEVNAGAAEEMGLNSRITIALRTSASKGSRNQAASASRSATP